VDKLAAFLEPCVHRVPSDVDISRRLRYWLTRKVADVVDSERVTEWVIAAVHHQRSLGVDERSPVADGLNASRVRFDEDEIIGHRRREPTCGIFAERTASGDKTHLSSFTDCAADVAPQ
jgi:hypothetical protein